MQFFGDIVGDAVLDVPRATLQCRFYNGRGELRSPAEICTMAQHKTAANPLCSLKRELSVGLREFLKNKTRSHLRLLLEEKVSSIARRMRCAAGSPYFIEK